ncbi:hypothetical protein [Luteibacter sp. E-22]|uniref:hypothetical protein n=1 Tax=Luteibacter sp. E-22 TaxID=3404050 RepID=UPI003CEDA9B1
METVLSQGRFFCFAAGLGFALALVCGAEPSLWWEPTLSAMDACLDRARCRGIADKVGSHQGVAVKQGEVLCGVRCAVCGGAAVWRVACDNLRSFASTHRGRD